QGEAGIDQAFAQIAMGVRLLLFKNAGHAVTKQSDLTVSRKTGFTLSSCMGGLIMIATGLGWGRNALLWILCLGVALVSWRFMAGGVEATMAFVAYHAQYRPIAFFAHVTLAPVALALVPFQLWQGLRNRRPMV